MLNQEKWQSPLGVSETYPDLAVHQEAVMHVYDPLLKTPWAAIDFDILLALLPCQPVQA